MGRLLPLPFSRYGLVLVLTALLVPVTPLLAQQLGQGSASADFSLWRVFAALVFLLLLAGAAWGLVKVRGRPLQLFKPMADRRIEIVETARLSINATLCLVRLDDAEYLLAVTQNGATLIEMRPVAQEAAEEGD